MIGLSTTAVGIFRKIFKRNKIVQAILLRNWPEVRMWVMRCPRKARALYRIMSDNGPTVAHPLHHSLMCNPPYQVVGALVKAYPAALVLCDSLHKRYPLHIACCESPNNFPVIETLLEAFPDIAMVRDKLGRLPLHYAIENKAASVTISLLLDYHPWSAAQPTEKGWYPLHMACALDLPYQIIQKLVQSWPPALSKKADGRKPSDIVAGGNATDKKKILEMLQEDEEPNLRLYPFKPNTMVFTTGHNLVM
jgi:hypothetical protein